MGNTLPPTDWGWRSQEGTLEPLETDIAIAPDTLLNMVSCGCKADGCSYMTCSCKKLGLFCTSMCSQCIGQTCNNTSPIIYADTCIYILTTRIFIILVSDCHLGRHLGFHDKLQGDSPGLLVCYSTDIPGPILKI